MDFDIRPAQAEEMGQLGLMASYSSLTKPFPWIFEREMDIVKMYMNTRFQLGQYPKEKVVQVAANFHNMARIDKQ